MEASSGAHHWARKLVTLGLDARIIAAHLVSPYRMQGKGGKNDANDAAAICEAASRPMMRFVPIKTISQQGMLCVHRLREGLKTERTACINRIRGLLAEFGLVFAQSPKALREEISSIIEDAENELAGIARLVIEQAQLLRPSKSQVGHPPDIPVFLRAFLETLPVPSRDGAQTR
jgi:transposase